ncbi:RNA polymerase sigma-70 factor [Pedobacter heparinus]|uniref:RNA polymerase sigma factor n=1 Tax=Pedobacter heparinus TaxID=984 RepID=UPI002931828A|nr:RNA polymerase sigma-70 factor [Pedobacter heparinus]
MTAYTSYTDQELTALLKGGDRNAFTEIYERYKAILFVHAYKRLANRDEAEDAVHDLFAAVWSGRENLNLDTDNLAGYLYRAVRNRVFKCIAKRSHADEYLSSIRDSVNAGQAITDYRVRENQLKAIIEKEVALLPSKMREVFELSRNSQLSNKEIARQLDLTEKTVKNHINHALKILRVKLGLFTFIWLLINY